MAGNGICRVFVIVKLKNRTLILRLSTRQLQGYINDSKEFSQKKAALRRLSGVMKARRTYNPGKGETKKTVVIRKITP